jgi:hypothetical protein
MEDAARQMRGVLPSLAGESTVLHTGILIVLLMTALELWVAADSHVLASGAEQGGVADTTYGITSSGASRLGIRSKPQ